MVNLTRPEFENSLVKPSSYARASHHSNQTENQAVGVLLIGADFQALGVARALAEHHVPMFLLETEPGIARYSRFINRRLAKHDLLQDSDSVNFMLQLADDELLNHWVIFCVDDEIVEYLAKNHTALSQKYVISVPEWDVTQKFYKKDRAMALASQIGIPVPLAYPSTSLEELLEADISYPVVLKPTFKKDYYEKTNNKAVLVQDRETLIHEFKAMNNLIDANQIMVQEFLIGGTRNLYSFAAVFDGDKVLAGLSAHRIRQHPMDFGHATTYAESRDMPQLEELATRFLRALNYRGIAEIEFMFDERTGTYKFIEMNGRFWGWHSLTFHAGLNYPMTLYRSLLGIETQTYSPRINVKWVRLVTDTPTIALEAFRGRMSPLKFVEVLCNGSRDAVWTWNDPLPFFMELIMAPVLWWRKGF